MPATLEKPATFEGRPETAQTPEQPRPEIPEYDETGLKEMVDQAQAQIDTEQVRAIDSADKRFDAAPKSVDLDEHKIATIKQNFIGRIKGIKNKIIEWGLATKTRTKEIIKPAAAAIPAEVPVADTRSNPTEEASLGVTPEKQDESLEYTTTQEQKEKAELQKYLEAEVFPSLGITKEAEIAALAEISGTEKEILERSFQNARDTLVALYEIETIEGRVDMGKMKTEKNRKTGELLYGKLTELLGKMDEKFSEHGILVSPADLGMNPDNVDVNDLPNKLLKLGENIKEKITAQVEEKINAILLSGQSFEGLALPTEAEQKNSKLSMEFYKKLSAVIAQETDKAFSQDEFHKMSHEIYEELRKMNMNMPLIDSEKFRNRLTREELTAQLLQETSKAQNTGFINVNLNSTALEKIISHGKFKDVFGMSREELTALGKGERGYADYIQNRKITETALGIHNLDGTVVYGTYASDNEDELVRGGASTYGDIFLKFKPSAKAVYTEGDSMWLALSETVTKKLRTKKIGSGYDESARARQIAPEHAAVTKAVLNFDAARHNSMQDESVRSTYLEAQILDPTLEDVESINIPKSAAGRVRLGSNFVNLIEQLQQDPFWREKINFTEA